MNIAQLLENSVLALKQASKFNKKRLIFNSLQQRRGQHFLGIIGPRGVGKSVLLRQLAHDQSNSIYISLDTLEQNLDLFELLKTILEDYKIEHFFLDEVHHVKNFDSGLKKIYDFLDISIYFTSSIALAMEKSKVDLARRVDMISLYPFSFYEYLIFTTEFVPKKTTLASLAKNSTEPSIVKYSSAFGKFLNGGNMPFALDEPNPFPLLENILEKILVSDIPKVYPVTYEETSIMREAIKHVGLSEIDGISYSSLSNNLKITKYKAKQYVEILESAFVLRQIFPAGTNVTKEPKIVMALPYRSLFKKDSLGGIREDFFCEIAKVNHLELHYLKSKRGEKTPDFLVTHDDKKYVFEIGGKGKGRSQFKGIDFDANKIVLKDSSIPLKSGTPLLAWGLMDPY